MRRLCTGDSAGRFTNGVSPLEMAAGYAALANDGMYREPTCIMRITDDTGAEVYLAAQEGQEVYRQNAARMMTDVLKGVFINGTGRGLGLSDMPCAGKTGTTNDHRTAGWSVIRDTTRPAYGLDTICPKRWTA